MKKSKYYIDNPFDVYHMTTSELKKFIRGASKSLSKKISAFRRSPLSKLSSMLQYYDNIEGVLGESLWKTKGVSRNILEDKVLAISALTEFNETALSVEHDVRESLMTRPFYIPEEIPDDKVDEYIDKLIDSGVLTAFYDDFEIYHDTVVAIIGSDRIQQIAEIAQDDTAKFSEMIYRETGLEARNYPLAQFDEFAKDIKRALAEKRNRKKRKRF